MLRDFLMLLRRYTASSVLNIIGMALAFASAYLILVQVNFDMSYNRKIPNAENIYRLERTPTQGGSWITLWDRYEPDDLCAGIPEIVAVTTISPYMLIRNYPFTINRNNNVYNLNIPTAASEREGLDLFGLIPVAGSFDQFTGPNTAIVSASYAKQHGLSVGDVLHTQSNANFMDIDITVPITIVAIYQDIPTPSDLSKCNLILGMPPKEQTQHGQWNYNAFIQLQEGASPEAVTDKMMALLRDKYTKSGMSPEEMEYKLGITTSRLNNLKDLYFHSNNVEFAAKTGNLTTTYTLLSVAILIIVIAGINFFNFFLALVPSRIRAFNTRKVFGGSNLRLRIGVVAETLGLIILALLIGAVLVLLFADSPLSDYITTDIFSADNLMLTIALIGIVLLIGVIISLYPAYYITSFPPALVTKGNFQSSASGMLLRNILVGIQFVTSTALIIVALFINLQHSYMMNYDMGFNKDEILTVQMKPFKSYAAIDAFTTKLKQNPMIVDVTFAQGDIVAPQRTSWTYTYNDQKISHTCYPVSWNFLKVMGIDMAEGRDFTKDDENRSAVFIFNEEAKRQFEFNLEESTFNGGPFESASLIGFCEDFHFKPLQYQITPFAFCVSNFIQWARLSHAYIRVAAGTDYREAMDYIHKTIRAFDPSFEEEKIHVKMNDEELGAYYEAEERLAKLITIFTLLSVVISIMGVFGLVLFETQYRRKEIGIRRVNGASVQSILKMFNMQFLRITLVCATVAIPISYYFVNRWLTGFSARMPMSWWVFVLAVVIICLIVVGTVTARSWKAASENPINSIQH